VSEHQFGGQVLESQIRAMGITGKPSTKTDPFKPKSSKLKKLKKKLLRKSSNFRAK
jgi:hypothetical protein